jgi:hypothetical protein
VNKKKSRASIAPLQGAEGFLLWVDLSALLTKDLKMFFHNHKRFGQRLTDWQKDPIFHIFSPLHIISLYCHEFSRNIGSFTSIRGEKISEGKN